MKFLTNMEYIIYHASKGLVWFYDGKDATELMADAKRYERIGDAMKVASELNENCPEPCWKIHSI